ncbi:D-amino-acid dehydrogenase [Paraburkholderia eburnea]|uniref:D-amino-acid dehydrogenase n=1 Tax=Paraburkholderia eburnea TaxID=1189126 RepID=A0A2S4MJM4_9BURK|nr:FAD-dependent oxidoreductase [Paraburkholderia eburnea]POR54984.1 D-amino-acid dehydrogenase [Paraburkholderia eburnea]PRZ24417.1 D-amino-acid dehydrogenase [Paraburkholderia eburnea]
MSKDAIVLGAGIVGVSVALHLQARGVNVTLVDRRAPGEETSYGNAGLIEASSVVPYGFPRDWRTLLRLARNDSTMLRYDARSLPAYARWLAAFWRESAPQRLAGAARDMLPLISRCVAEHEALIARTDLRALVRPIGWLQAYRSPQAFEREREAAQRLADEHHLRTEVFDAAGLRAAEPSLNEGYAGAIHWIDPASVADPGALVKGYAQLFLREGGRFATGDARTLRAQGGGWQVQTDDGPLAAELAVVAMGPWSDQVTAPLGYRVPLMAKRGYHMHYASAAGAPLLRPVVDIEGGYVVAPMRQGLRLTTGVELATRNRPPNYAQLDAAERAARPVFGLGERIDDMPWMGMRPCTPDMRPVLGPAPRHAGLWFAFGHNHHGLTLGPVSGRLVAEQIMGERPFTDPAPYSPTRFA